MSDIIQLENKFYVSASSSYADDRVKVLNFSDTFGIFDRLGDIRQFGDGVQGIYHEGTRFVSELELRINGVRPQLLSSTVKEENEILSVDLTNPNMQIDGQESTIPKATIYMGRSKFILNGACYEQIELNNYGEEQYEFDLTVYVQADFKDIFEVRGISRSKRGELYEIKHIGDAGLGIAYRGLDSVERRTEVHFSEKPVGWERHNKAIFHVVLAANEQKSIGYSIHFILGQKEAEIPSVTAAKEMLDVQLRRADKSIARVTTSNHRFNQWIRRSQFDLLSLLAQTPYGHYPYAGVPWYNTAFGRDGIITALETLWIMPDLARDVLHFLAGTQSTQTNPEQDSEPGKIIHEVRGGEMAELQEIPFKRYYGSVDSTPLFVMLAGAYYVRTADIDTIKSIWQNIVLALHWIDRYGDIDGDGFLEYHRMSGEGLINQGWKDSHDSAFYEDGELARPPIAICEVQGYVYSAKKYAAILAHALGNLEDAARLDAEAEQLKRQFNEQFWDEDLQCYILALDGEKKPCRVIASNAGHCLYSGIADHDKAARVVRTLVQPDMFSGWGIRTISTQAKRYNPMSYHNGSIWPHDVALIAEGFSRYGFVKEARLLTHALFEASQYIELQRLPELFCGFTRRRGEGPTGYPVACSPQAWAVVAVFQLLHACLGIEIDARKKTVQFRNSLLPDEVERIRISQLKLGDGFAHFELRDGDTVDLNVFECPESWKIET